MSRSNNIEACYLSCFVWLASKCFNHVFLSKDVSLQNFFLKKIWNKTNFFLHCKFQSIATCISKSKLEKNSNRPFVDDVTQIWRFSDDYSPPLSCTYVLCLLYLPHTTTNPLSPTCMTSFMNGSLSKVNLIVIRADTEALYLWSDVLQALHFLLTCQNKLFLFSFWTSDRKLISMF